MHWSGNEGTFTSLKAHAYIGTVEHPVLATRTHHVLDWDAQVLLHCFKVLVFLARMHHLHHGLKALKAHGLHEMDNAGHATGLRAAAAS